MSDKRDEWPPPPRAPEWPREYTPAAGVQAMTEETTSPGGRTPSDPRLREIDEIRGSSRSIKWWLGVQSAIFGPMLVLGFTLAWNKASDISSAIQDNAHEIQDHSTRIRTLEDRTREDRTGTDEVGENLSHLRSDLAEIRTELRVEIRSLKQQIDRMERRMR